MLEVKHKILEGLLVGIDDHVEDVRELLDIESPDVQYIVIHGVGGVGKTTLAKVMFNQLYMMVMEAATVAAFSIT